MTILVCTDGQAHSDIAIERAISLAQSKSTNLVALYVIDSWLKQFSSDIYAQGRQAYLDYVDACLAAEAGDAKARFESLSEDGELDARFIIRRGEPFQVIFDEIKQIAPSTVVFGGKKLTKWGQFRSRKLPGQFRNGIARLSVDTVSEQVA